MRRTIERGELRQTIMELIAEAVARDMEELVIKGAASTPINASSEDTRCTI